MKDRAQKNDIEIRNTSLCGMSSGLQRSLSPLGQNARVYCCAKPVLKFNGVSAICVESNLEKSCGRNAIFS
jgi:hypothetical protein